MAQAEGFIARLADPESAPADHRNLWEVGATEAEALGKLMISLSVWAGSGVVLDRLPHPDRRSVRETFGLSSLRARESDRHAFLADEALNLGDLATAKSHYEVAAALDLAVARDLDEASPVHAPLRLVLVTSAVSYLLLARSWTRAREVTGDPLFRALPENTRLTLMGQIARSILLAEAEADPPCAVCATAAADTCRNTTGVACPRNRQ